MQLLPGSQGCCIPGVLKQNAFFTSGRRNPQKQGGKEPWSVSDPKAKSCTQMPLCSGMAQSEGGHPERAAVPRHLQLLPYKNTGPMFQNFLVFVRSWKTGFL